MPVVRVCDVVEGGGASEKPDTRTHPAHPNTSLTRRTGTGIGRRNMPAFTTFVSMICVCLIFDVRFRGGRGLLEIPALLKSCYASVDWAVPRPPQQPPLSSPPLPNFPKTNRRP